MEANLLVDISAVSGPPGGVTHQLVAYGVGRHAVCCVRRISAPVLGANPLLIAHVERVFAHVVSELVILKRRVRVGVVASAEDGVLQPFLLPMEGCALDSPEFCASKTAWTLVTVGQSKASSITAALTIIVMKQKISRFLRVKKKIVLEGE